MSEKHTGKPITSDYRMREEDWRRVEALTDEEIEAAIADDPDAQFPADPDLWKNARVVVPNGTGGVWLNIDPETLEWFRDRHISLRLFMQNVLKQYMETQRNK